MLPAPVVSSRVAFIARAGRGRLGRACPAGLAGDSGVAGPAVAGPGAPDSRIRVGGYLGFAASLNTALRGDSWATQLVMQVRAQRPSYWVGETFDTWQGTQLDGVEPVPRRPLRQGSPFVAAARAGRRPLRAERPADLLRRAARPPTSSSTPRAPRRCGSPPASVYAADDGTIVSPIGLGSGSIYTVDSQVSTATPAQLRTDASPQTLPPVDAERRRSSCPHPYPRVLALAQSVTARGRRRPTTRCSRSSTGSARTPATRIDIPPLPPGADTVDEFLFGNRVGFCEQISTSLAVMLRSLGIPAREAVGYVPGGYDPITDLYQVHADDAHAWVQVWFPGYGWQNFDPTAVVPPGQPQPGRHRAARRRRAPCAGSLRCRSPLVLGGRRPGRRAWCAGAGHGRPRGRRRVARRAERAGRRAGPAAPSLRDPGRVRRRRWTSSTRQRRPTTWSRLASSVEASAYGGLDRRPRARHGRRGAAHAGRRGRANDGCEPAAGPCAGVERRSEA